MTGPLGAMTGPFIGIMSGTSLDGADAVLATFDQRGRPALIASAAAPFDPSLRAELLALQRSGPDELDRAALAANRLADFQAALVGDLCRQADVPPATVVAIGSHGQTVRHRPERGYTLQLNAPARLAEATGITVVSDFRSRDVAAGGHGAPLVPAFHDALFRRPGTHRVVLNLGGMSNVTDLPADVNAVVRGWDCGPGNVLLDGWIARHHGKTHDAAGAWARSGTVDAGLLQKLLADEWFALPPPKSTGRDRFDLAWLDRLLAGEEPLAPVDVQATLAALTAISVADSIVAHAGTPDQVIVCGGGAYNDDLLARLAARLSETGRVRVSKVGEADDDADEADDDAKTAPEHVEALAFAWLAMRCLAGRPGNLPAVTGARGLRILGSITPK